MITVLKVTTYQETAASLSQSSAMVITDEMGNAPVASVATFYKKVNAFSLPSTMQTACTTKAHTVQNADKVFI